MFTGSLHHSILGGSKMKKIVTGFVLLFALILLVGFVAANTAVDQNDTTTVTPTVTTITTTPIPTNTTGEQPPLANIYSITLTFAIIAILATLPWVMNTWHNMSIRNKLLNECLNIPDPREKAAYIDKLLAPFPERKGLTRFSLMLSIILTLGAIVLYFATVPTNDMVKTIVGALTGALTTIVGFYFGTRALSGQNETGSGNGTGGPRKKDVKITAIRDTDTNKVTITNTGGNDVSLLQTLKVEVNDAVPPDAPQLGVTAGSSIEIQGSTGGQKDHIIVTGTFQDGITQALYDQFI